MHRNPVVRGLVASPEDWRWSSYRSYAYGEAGLANNLTTNNWPNVFGGNPSDGVVPLTSQINGANTGGSPGGGGPVTNVIHSAGLYGLDFVGSNELNSGVMAGDAMDLLNEPKNGPDYQ